MTTIGKLWTGAVAYVSLLVGAGLSVAGNLADTYRTRGADIDNLDKIMAAAWPILVILAIEMFVSPRWSPKPMFQVWRWVGCLAVGGMAMVVSWTHLHDLMSARGQLVVVAVLGPLAIDGMAIMATGLILSTRVRGHVDTGAVDTPPSMSDVLEAKDAATLKAWHSDVSADTQTPADTDAAGTVSADEYASGGYVRRHETDNPWTDTYVPADTDTRAGHDRWADLVDTAMSTADGIMFDDPRAADMSTVKADADKLNGMATWAQWTSADDAMVADMKRNPIVVTDIGPGGAPLPKRTRTAAGQSYPAEFTDMVAAWDPSALERADLVKLLAAYFDVSARTVRRWLAAFTEQPVSGPPEE